MAAMHPHVATSFAILRFQDRMAGRTRPEMEQIFSRILDVFADLGLKWTLVGAHAVNTYAEPRATMDIDFVVDARMLAPLLARLEQDLGPLVIDDIGAAQRLMNLSVDLIRSDNHPLFRAALDDAVERHGVRVPPAELLVALKFLAATSPWRKAADRAQDVADLIRVYGTTPFDRAVCLAYAAKVYPDADRELAEILDRADRGDKISI
jgi:hypothetical protein